MRSKGCHREEICQQHSRARRYEGKREAHLESLKSSVANDDLLRESSLDERVDLGGTGVVLESLSEVDESGSGSFSEGGLSGDELEEIGDGRESREGGVGDWKKKGRKGISDAFLSIEFELEFVLTFSTVEGHDLESLWRRDQEVSGRPRRKG